MSEQPTGPIPIDRPEQETGDGEAGKGLEIARPILEGRDVRRVYTEQSGNKLTVLDGVDVAISRAEAVAVIGASGAGKSTLLHILGCLDRPTTGEILLRGRSVSGLSDPELAAIRNRQIGFVFQFHHLLREFTALENVMMPMLIGGREPGAARDRAADLLDQVGLWERLSHKPGELSGGEQQRVAVARALANRPAVLIADEPSGNLDTSTSDQLHDLLFQVREQHGVAMVVATHNRELADRADRILLLKESRLHSFHLGKVYLPPDPSLAQRTERLAGLRRKLSWAVESENFERAAEIRDEIQELEAADTRPDDDAV